MQIIPDKSAFFGSAVYSNLTLEAQNSMSFLEAMDSALSSVEDGDNHSASSALEENQTGPLVDSPYTRHTTDGITYTLSEVCFTKQELLELRQQLLKEGAPEESLQQFDILASQPDGATLAQVMASLLSNQGGMEISEDDASAITSLLGKIDPTGELAANSLDLMRSGNRAGALDLIRGALGELSATDSLDVDLEGILALGRGLGLGKDAMRNLAAGFGGADSLTLNGSQLDALLKPAQNFLLEESARSQKLDAALDKTLKAMISKARDRMEKEQEASELQNRRVEQSRILIDKTVQKNSRQILDETLTANEKLEAKMQLSEDLAQDIKNELLKDENINPQAALHNLTVEGKQSMFGQNGADSDGSMRQSKNREDSWQNLFGKVRTNTAAQPMSTPVSFAAAQTAAQPQNLAFSNPLTASPTLPTYAASQVEQGMLTALRNGATRLDLQLHPAELGPISITLISRNGEVTAQLRSEKGETAEMLTRQLDTIRVNLEQQGVKVDKIEVQLENRQDNAQNQFGDLGQHNARQEEDARRQELNRLRNLASIRNSSEKSEDSVLERSLHDNVQTARYAGRALNVVA